MSELFERWVESIVREWARGFGGVVTTAREGTARYPVLWQRRGAGTLNSLAPDVVVQMQDTTFIFDAKYKGHLEELDDQRWRELREEIQSEHRHDLHQAFAYAALFDTPRVVSSLVYPVFASSWETMRHYKRNMVRALLASQTRQVETCLVGIPLQLLPGQQVQNIASTFNELRVPIVG